MSFFGKGLQRICAVVAAPTSAKMIEQVRLALRETPTVELRLDWLASDLERSRFLAWLTKNKTPRSIFLATCRRSEGGGKFLGNAEAELNWLKRAREAGCLWCDIEIETLRKLHTRPLRTYGVPEKILLSLHNFQRMPSVKKVGKIFARYRQEVTAVKIAAQSSTYSGSLQLLELAKHLKDCVAVPMGDIGLPARILALRKGGALAYAPVADATAPGQVSLQDFRHLYRSHELDRQTQVFGVIGNPVAHSLSPLLHNTGFIARGLNAVYLPFLVKNLREFLSAVPDFGLRGFSVTLPHKTAILRHLAGCDSLAAEIGAVNTVVVRRDGSLYGCNTDYIGVLQSLDKRLQLDKSRVLIFGAGGSARAAAFALARAGAAVFICARKEHAARQLARDVGGEALQRRALKTHSFDAILNSTPVGMHPNDHISPLAPGELHCRIVMDLIYHPEKTRLLKLASRKGIAVVSGVEMFLAQGIAQWEIWTKQIAGTSTGTDRMKTGAPVAAMRKAVLAALRAEDDASSKPKRRTS